MSSFKKGIRGGLLDRERAYLRRRLNREITVKGCFYPPAS
jgi:hypothetical protein